MSSQKQIHLLGVPMDLGQNRRGVDMGPSALRYAGLQPRLERLGYRVHDSGNVTVPIPEEASAKGGTRRLHAIAEVCTAGYEWGRAVRSAETITLYLGGDHSMSIGSVKALPDPATTGVIWVDAHADFNTPQSSPSGNIHGMPVAVLAGDGADPLVRIGNGVTVPERNIVQIGIRDVDSAERKRLQASEIAVFTMRQVDEQGMAAIAKQTLAKLSHCTSLHISLDLDALDPSEAPGVGTAVRGGLTYREAHLLMEILGDSGKVISADVVEVNPILDRGNTTAELAVELVASLFGKRIM